MRRNCWRWMSLLLALGVAGPSAAARASSDEKPAVPSRFGASVELVSLNVTVLDARQRLLRGLAADDFRVYEDGVLQDIELFAGDSVPLDVAVLLDTSASIGSRMPVIQTAAIGFLRALRAGDRATLIGFRDSAQVLAPWTRDLAKVEDAVRRAQALGGTSLFTSLYVAIREFDRRPSDLQVRRQAIVVLSDGNDTASLMSFDDVLEACQRAGIAVYTIRLSRRDPRGRPRLPSALQAEGDYALRRLSTETGARSFALASVGDLADVYSSIAEELAGQYVVAYAPKPSARAHTYRRIQVIVARPGVHPRTRTGYFAVESRFAVGRGTR